MAFLLNRTPRAPIEKIIPDKTKYAFGFTCHLHLHLRQALVLQK
jgi:hypothetical protein